MTALIRLIKSVKEEILKYKNEYERETPLSTIIKEKKIIYEDPILNIKYSNEEVLLALKYYKDRGRYNLVFCISVPEETNVKDYEKYFNIEEIDEDKLRYEELSLGKTYENWVLEEENSFFWREQKKKEYVEFLSKYYPEVLIKK